MTSGWICLGYFKDAPDDVLARWGVSKVGEIVLMAVDENYRNRGIGTAKNLYDKLGFEVRAYHMKKGPWTPYQVSMVNTLRFYAKIPKS